MKDKELKLTCFSIPLLCRGAVEFLGFGGFFMHLHILHIMQSKFIKTNPKETQSECVVSLWGGGGGEVGVAPIVVIVVYIYHASEMLNQCRVK